MNHNTTERVPDLRDAHGILTIHTDELERLRVLLEQQANEIVGLRDQLSDLQQNRAAS